jgi:diaminohydroxyphosphoribosylaminopyrimidine deaminase/5-amino-6-(5-phosphoribosylamino)uracil reductase
VLVFTAAGNEAKLAGWATDGAEVIALPGSDSGLSLDAVLANLGARRFTNVLVEGGAGLFGAFVDAKLVDEFHVFVAPKLIGGGDALSPLGGAGVAKMADALQLIEFTSQPSGSDVYLHGFASSSLPS